MKILLAILFSMLVALPGCDCFPDDGQLADLSEESQAEALAEAAEAASRSLRAASSLRNFQPHLSVRRPVFLPSINRPSRKQHSPGEQLKLYNVTLLI